MQKQEYTNIYNQEGQHFFYVGNHLLILNLVKRFAGNNGELQILDAGCGTGMLAKKLAQFGKVVGVDVSPEAFRLSKKRGIDVKLASITNLPFKNYAFDLVVSVDVLYHQQVTNDQQAIREFKRVLKPGGVLIIKVPAYNWLRGSHDVVVQTKKRYTTHELERITHKAGFVRIKASYFASFLLPIAIIKRAWETWSKPQESHSDVLTPGKILNNILIFFYRLEIKLLDFVDIPTGLSVFIVAKKP